MKALRKTISSGLAKARELRGLSQSDLAGLVGMMPSAIAHFEAARRMPSVENLLKLSDALEISLDDLFGRTHDRTMWVNTPFAARIEKCMAKMKTRDQQVLADLATLIVQGKRVGVKAGAASDD